MHKITELIRSEREFLSFVGCMKETLATEECLPIAVNGLSGGAESAFLAEAVKEAARISHRPILVLVENEAERIRVTDLLASADINAVGYKRRDPVFHNIRASHDVDRERLSVLSGILSGKVDVVVSTPSAAAMATMPMELLDAMSIDLRVGDVIAPESLADRLVHLGFAPVENVESRGQFSRRGGILDFFGGESEQPVRVEFFGDEIDRLSYFDTITQRSGAPCDGVSLLPAAEVVVDKEARGRILASIERLLPKVTDETYRARLIRERAVLESDVGIDFRDKYLPLIYERGETLFDNMAKGGRYI